MNTDSKKLRFDGRGFDKDPFTEAERAEMRERAKHYDDHFLNADDFLKATGLGWFSSMAKGFPAFIRAAATIVTLGGAFAILKTYGVI